MTIGGAKLIGVFGRLTPWKGQHVAIESVANLLDVHLMIVGDAMFCDEDRAYAQSLHRQISELGMTDRVHFLGFRDDVPTVMKACDVIVHCPTSPEPFSGG